MAFFTVQFYSDILRTSVTANVIMPQQHTDQTNEKNKINDLPRVLYLLHGYCDDYSTWMRRTSIERYAEDMNMAVIMPSVNHSFYCNELHGERYWDYISDELPRVMHRFFRLSDKPEDTFAAGLSMGGYGAMRLALTYPERFAAAASFSGLVDIAYEVRVVTGENKVAWERVMGDFDQIAGSPLDLMYLLKQNAGAPSKPSLYVSCGTSDILYQHHLNIKQALKGSAWVYQTEDIPGATHEWGFWDSEIQKFLAFINKQHDRLPKTGENV